VEPSALPHDPITIDAVLLGNAIEVREGLAYGLGLGWSRCWPNPGQSYPLTRGIPILLVISVPWEETNAEHTFAVTIHDADERVAADNPPSGTFRVGRPSDGTFGMWQRVVVNVGIQAVLPTPGIYAVVISINGTEAHRVSFEAVAQAPGPTAGR
jgi:hypothetical protein